ncbi:MAG: SDR family NAD(P)-dependent oxidoreductase, partial [Burkholderiales bacterium]
MNSQSSQDFGLAGKVAIVTGGGAAGDGIGNGRAAAILLARVGARVLVVDQKFDLAQRTVKMITDEGGKAAAFAADVTDEAQCRAMVETALSQFG